MLKRNDSSRFDLLAYFEGRTLAHGVFEDRKGRVKRRFNVEMTGRWEAGAMVVDEDFLFDDGERQQRCWTLMPKSDTEFTGRCPDSLSEARGSLSDGCAHFRSSLRIKAGGRLISMDFDDAFYDSGDGLVLNRSSVSKWGFRLGQILIAFRKA